MGVFLFVIFKKYDIMSLIRTAKYMEFRRVNAEERNIILSIYNQVKNSQFCSWNEYYPTIDEVEHDYCNNNLFCLVDGGEILGALSIVEPNEMDTLECWQVKTGLIKEIARVVVAPIHQGKGLAKLMLSKIVESFKALGVSAIHLSVAKNNIPAQKTYERVGFKMVGETVMYGGDYNLMEYVF